VIIELSAEAGEFGRQVQRALEAAGADSLLTRAVADPTSRATLVEPVLDELGAWDLEPRGDPDDLEAAAALCRAAGWWATPYPVAERCARLPDGGDALVAVADAAPRAPVAGLDLRLVAVTLDGRAFAATGRAPAAPARETAFVVDLDVVPRDETTGARDVALALVLPCWTLLGMLDRALALTRDYVVQREQFGQALASFQSVQFQLTDAEVERAGLEELAKYALWSVQRDRPEAVDDALAVREAAIEAAETAFRVAHQLHGAIGFTDEMTLSWVSRASRPLRRLPLGLSATRDALVRRLGRRGLTGLFSEAGTP
jgi:hypothetical protein